MVRQATSGLMVFDDADALAEAVASQLIERLAAVQTMRGSASLVLTGGRTGIAVLDKVRESHARDSVDWSRVDFFWGDERFVRSEDPDRNELQARRALLDHLDAGPARVHPMPASDGAFGDDAEASAEAYRRVLARHRTAGEPLFDICLLRVGEDGHVASLFPGLPAAGERHLTAVAVHASPKPPATRVTLTLPALCDSREVWLFATGATKADAVSSVLSGSAGSVVPAAGVRGRERTLWFVDSAAVGTKAG